MKKDSKAETQNQPEQKKGLRILKIVINTIINILIVLILIVSIIIAAMSITSKANNGLPSIFGYTIQSIQSKSMEGGSDKYEGGDLKEGDLIISKATDFIFDLEYDEGDIVTFMTVPDDSESEKRVPVCHRIIEVYEQNGERAYRTMGDNNGKADQVQGDYTSYRHAGDIGAVYWSKDYHGIKIAGLGKFLDFIQTQFGFFIVILLPMIIFFLYALVRVVINAMNYRKARENELVENAEKEKQEAVDAAVAAALAQKDSEKPQDPADMTPEQMEQFKQFLAYQEAQKKAEQPPEEEE